MATRRKLRKSPLGKVDFEYHSIVSEAAQLHRFCIESNPTKRTEEIEKFRQKTDDLQSIFPKEKKELLRLRKFCCDPIDNNTTNERIRLVNNEKQHNLKHFYFRNWVIHAKMCLFQRILALKSLRNCIKNRQEKTRMAQLQFAFSIFKSNLNHFHLRRNFKTSHAVFSHWKNWVVNKKTSVMAKIAFILKQQRLKAVLYSWCKWKCIVDSQTAIKKEMKALSFQNGKEKEVLNSRMEVLSLDKQQLQGEIHDWQCKVEDLEVKLLLQKDQAAIYSSKLESLSKKYSTLSEILTRAQSDLKLKVHENYSISKSNFRLARDNDEMVQKQKIHRIELQSLESKLQEEQNSSTATEDRWREKYSRLDVEAKMMKCNFERAQNEISLLRSRGSDAEKNWRIKTEECQNFESKVSLLTSELKTSQTQLADMIKTNQHQQEMLDSVKDSLNATRELLKTKEEEYELLNREVVYEQQKCRTMKANLELQLTKSKSLNKILEESNGVIVNNVHCMKKVLHIYMKKFDQIFNSVLRLSSLKGIGKDIQNHNVQDNTVNTLNTGLLKCRFTDEGNGQSVELKSLRSNTFDLQGTYVKRLQVEQTLRDCTGFLTSKNGSSQMLQLESNLPISAMEIYGKYFPKKNHLSVIWFYILKSYTSYCCSELTFIMWMRALTYTKPHKDSNTNRSTQTFLTGRVKKPKPSIVHLDSHDIKSLKCKRIRFFQRLRIYKHPVWLDSLQGLRMLNEQSYGNLRTLRNKKFLIRCRMPPKRFSTNCCFVRIKRAMKQQVYPRINKFLLQPNSIRNSHTAVVNKEWERKRVAFYRWRDFLKNKSLFKLFQIQNCVAEQIQKCKVLMLEKIFLKVLATISTRKSTLSTSFCAWKFKYLLLSNEDRTNILRYQCKISLKLCGIFLAWKYLTFSNNQRKQFSRQMVAKTDLLIERIVFLAWGSLVRIGSRRKIILKRFCQVQYLHLLSQAFMKWISYNKRHLQWQIAFRKLLVRLLQKLYFISFYKWKHVSSVTKIMRLKDSMNQDKVVKLNCFHANEIQRIKWVHATQNLKSIVRRLINLHLSRGWRKLCRLSDSILLRKRHIAAGCALISGYLIRCNERRLLKSFKSIQLFGCLKSMILMRLEHFSFVVSFKQKYQIFIMWKIYVRREKFYSKQHHILQVTVAKSENRNLKQHYMSLWRCYTSFLKQKKLTIANTLLKSICGFKFRLYKKLASCFYKWKEHENIHWRGSYRLTLLNRIVRRWECIEKTNVWHRWQRSLQNLKLTEKHTRIVSGIMRIHRVKLFCLRVLHGKSNASLLSQSAFYQWALRCLSTKCMNLRQRNRQLRVEIEGKTKKIFLQQWSFCVKENKWLESEKCATMTISDATNTIEELSRRFDANTHKNVA